MTITFIGLIQAAIGLLILLRGSLASGLVFLMISGLFGGSAAIILTSLGGSSIPPAQFALAFVWIRLIMPGSRFLPSIGPAFRQNLWLMVFVIYGVSIAYVGPRLFAGQLNVTPLRFEGAGGGLFDAVPLAPSSQNMTATVYLIGVLLTAVAAYVACLHRGGAHALVKTGVVVSWIHAITGLVGAFTRGTPVEDAFDLLRNASYAQLTQGTEGFARINGIFPEPSAWAGFAFAWFVFNAECWYRSIESKSTGRAALLLAVVLFFSTSSTAYIGLGGYALFFFGRVVVFPNLSSASRLKEGALLALAMMMVVALVLALVPAFANALGDMLDDMLFNKADSESGRQRLFWALQGLDGFRISWGLGIGPGSFRSSSLVTAIIGSMGVIGMFSFVAYLFGVFVPSRASSWGASGALAGRLGGAAATATILSTIPALVSASTPVPTGEFAILAGAALALRRVRDEEAERSGDDGGVAAVQAPDRDPGISGGWRG